MELKIPKGCLIDNHNSGFICMVCVSKDCQSKNRTICSQCNIDEQYNHNKCNDFLTFKSIDQYDLQFLDKTKINMQEMMDNILNLENSFCQKIEEKYQKMIDKMAEKINQKKKEHKIQVLSKIEEVKSEIQKYLEKEKHFMDFSDLQEDINKFKNGEIDIQQLNHKMNMKQQQNENKQFKQNLAQRYQNLGDIDQLSHIKDTNLIFSGKMNFSIANFPSKKINFSFKPFPQYYPHANQIVSNYHSYSFLSNITMQSHQTFSKYDRIHFKFQYYIQNQEQFGLYLGIASCQTIKQTFWFDSGNQLRLDQNDKSSQGFVKKGSEGVEQVFQNRQIYEMIVYIDKNQMVIQTEDGKCIMQSTCKFDQNISQWMVVIGFQQGNIVKIL